MQFELLMSTNPKQLAVLTNQALNCHQKASIPSAKRW